MNCLCFISSAFWNADEKKDVHVPVDYCSEKLHDYFVDRKFRGESGNARKLLFWVTGSSYKLTRQNIWIGYSSFLVEFAWSFLLCSTSLQIFCIL